jgi:CxxC motif-containing protein
MKIVCIVCPNGCRMTARATAKGLKVTGHTCARGERYAREEATDPKRVVTAVVRTTSKQWPCLPVKTQQPIPKRMIPRLLRSLYALEVTLPVRRRDPVITDIEGTGVDVVFTRSAGSGPPVAKRSGRAAGTGS